MSEETGFSEQELKKFSEAGRTIAAAIGTSVELWARAEAGVILKTWAGRTKVAKERPLEISGLMRAYRVARRVAGFGDLKNKGSVKPGEAGINLGLRRGQEFVVWYRTRKKHKFQPVYRAGFAPGWRIASADWPEVSGMVQNFRAHFQLAVDAAKGAAGLARQSIVQIADDLGIHLEDVKGGGTLSAAGLHKAREALASNKTFYRNGYGVTSQNAQEFYLTLINRYPKIGPLFMDATLRQVIAGRMRYFHRNLEEGSFLSAKAAAKAYPYLDVLRTAA